MPQQNGLPKELPTTPHDAQAHHPKRVWWSSETPKLPHNEKPLSPKDISEANPQHIEHKEAR